MQTTLNKCADSLSLCVCVVVVVVVVMWTPPPGLVCLPCRLFCSNDVTWSILCRMMRVWNGDSFFGSRKRTDKPTLEWQADRRDRESFSMSDRASTQARSRLVSPFCKNDDNNDGKNDDGHDGKGPIVAYWRLPTASRRPSIGLYLTLLDFTLLDLT